MFDSFQKNIFLSRKNVCFVEVKLRFRFIGSSLAKEHNLFKTEKVYIGEFSANEQ